MNRDRHRFPPTARLHAAIAIAIAATLAAALAGCTTNTVTIADVSPRPTSVFGEPRPAVVAELHGTDAVVPSRAAAGGSWVKRHLATERGRLDAFAAERRTAAADPTPYGPAIRVHPRPGDRRVKPPTRPLKPSDFDPNHLI